MESLGTPVMKGRRRRTRKVQLTPLGARYAERESQSMHSEWSEEGLSVDQRMSHDSGALSASAIGLRCPSTIYVLGLRCSVLSMRLVCGARYRLRAGYVVHGTDVACCGTRTFRATTVKRLSSLQNAVTGAKHPIVLCICYAMCSTDIRYAATRLSRR